MQKDIVYTFCTSNMEPFKILFYSSLRGNWDIVHDDIDTLVEKKAGGGMPVWEFKTKKVIELIKNNINRNMKIFIFDLDIQFFTDILDAVTNVFKETNADILFQKETAMHGVNIGICIIRPNVKTLSFWQGVYDYVKKHNMWDQEAVNQFIWKQGIADSGKPDIRIALLPSTFWTNSTSFIPYDMCLHHANCVSSLNDKWNQYEFIQDILGMQIPFSERIYSEFINSKNILFSTLADGAEFENVTITDSDTFIIGTRKFDMIKSCNTLILHNKRQIFASFNRLIYADTLNKGVYMGFLALGHERKLGKKQHCFLVFQ